MPWKMIDKRIERNERRKEVRRRLRELGGEMAERNQELVTERRKLKRELSGLKLRISKKVQFFPLKEVRSDGISGKDGIREIESAGHLVHSWAKDAMGHPLYVVTNGELYKPIIIDGSGLTPAERMFPSIRMMAEEMKFVTPPAELARLLLLSVSGKEIKEMGFEGLIIMHEPLGGHPGWQDIFGVICLKEEQMMLMARAGHSKVRAGRKCGLVFLAPPKK